MGYRIKTVSEMLGVPRNTLLAWERRYTLIAPDRQDNGYREYSAEDVARLREVKRLIDEGHKVSEAISMMQEQPPRTRPHAPLPTADQLLERLLAALLAYDRTSADRLIKSLAAVSYRQQIEDVYFPLLRQVGAGWCRGEITIAQEHYTSAFVREQFVAMLLSLEHGPERGPLAVCAAYPTEPHDLSLLALSVILALKGYRVVFLGAQVPLADLCQLVAQQAPALVCIAVVLPPPPAELLAYAKALAGVATGRLIIGGAGVALTASAVAGVEWHPTLDAIL